MLATGAACSYPPIALVKSFCSILIRVRVIIPGVATEDARGRDFALDDDIGTHTLTGV